MNDLTFTVYLIFQILQIIILLSMQAHLLRSSGIAIVLILICGSVTAQRFFTDTRDNSMYEVFGDGDQLRLKENLKFKTPTSWGAEHPESDACAYGNYYYPTDLINVCPDGWRVPTWFDYRRALKDIAAYYELTDALKYEESKLPLYRNLKLEGEMVTGLTLIGD